jgi:hypothetical protein
MTRTGHPLRYPPTEAELHRRDVRASAVARQLLQEATERKSKRKPRPK